MAQKYGFFNSLNSDRLYNAETFNKYFRGIISEIGVFSNCGTKFACSCAREDNTNIVMLDTGKLLVNCHWLEIEGDKAIVELDDAHPTLDRIDIISARWSDSTRKVELTVIKGTPSKAPKAPGYVGRTSEIVGSGYGINDESGIVDLPLYAIRVSPSRVAPIIEMSYIGTYVCPYICHLVIGPDETDVEAWLARILEAIMRWNSELQNELQVSTYIQSYEKPVDGGSNVSNTIALDMPNYVYSEGDHIFAFYNGMALIRDKMTSNEEYAPDSFYVDNQSDPPTLTIQGSMSAGNSLDIIALKSQIGVPSYMNGDGISY